MRYRNGQPLLNRRDILDRARYLQEIQQALQIIFADKAELASMWIKRPNKHFDCMSPLEIMKKRGILGVLSVRGLLYYEKEQSIMRYQGDADEK